MDEGSKVILTSRTEYFRWAKESEKILSGGEYGRGTIVLSPPKFEVVYIEPMDAGQIREIILRRLGPKHGPLAADHIQQNPKLSKMASKPVLIELLLAALDSANEGLLENPGTRVPSRYTGSSHPQY